MRKQFLIPAFLLFLLVAQRYECQSLLKIQPDAHANPPQDSWVLNDVDLNGHGNLGRIRVVQALPQSIAPKKYPMEFWEGDCYRITVEDFHAPLIYAEEFCTSYGKFALYVANLTGGPNPDLIFELYKNRGTEATEKYFVVKHWDGKKLVTKATIVAGMWLSHTAQGPLAEYSKVPAYCSRELKLMRMSDKQYEAIFPLDPGCIEIMRYLIPQSDDERKFLREVSQKLVYDSHADRYHLVDMTPGLTH